MAKSFKTEFVKYYKEKLEPLGFVKVKGAQPYFVRVVKDEILHIITYMEVPSTQYGYKSFHLMCGVATVYRKEINFTVSPKNNSDWLVALGTINEKKDTEYPLVAIPRNLMEFYYNMDNIEAVLEETWKGTMILLNELNKVEDMDRVLWYLLKYDVKNVSFLQSLDESCFDEEALYYVRKQFDYTKVYGVFKAKRFDLAKSLLRNEEKEKKLLAIDKYEKSMEEARMNLVSNADIYQRCMDLLEKHYHANISRLSDYGIDVKEKDINDIVRQNGFGIDGNIF